MSLLLSLPVEILTEILGLFMPINPFHWYEFDPGRSQCLQLRLVCRDFETIISRMVLGRKGHTFVLPEEYPKNSYTMTWLLYTKCQLDDMQQGRITTYFRQWASFMSAQEGWQKDGRPMSETEWLKAVCSSAIESYSPFSVLARLLRHGDGEVPSDLNGLDLGLPQRLLERHKDAADGVEPGIVRDAIGALHISAQQGNHTAVNALLVSGADPKFKHPLFGYPEDNAVCAGHVDIVFLLQKYGSTREPRTHPVRLLHVAAKRGYAQIFRYLLDSAPLLFDKSDLYSWLESACERGNFGIVRELFSWIDCLNDEDPRVKVKRGFVDKLLCRPKLAKNKFSASRGLREEDQRHIEGIIKKAIRHGRAEIVQFLIARHEFRPLKAKDTLEPLFAAARQDQGNILTVLLDHYNVQVSVYALLLRDAAYYSSVSAMRAILNRPDIKMDGWPSSSQAALLVAIKYGARDARSEEIVRLLLLRKDANPNIICEKSTPLEAAIERNYPAMVKLLTGHPNLDPNMRGHSHSPLCDAVRENKLKIVRLLVERPDTDVNQCCSNGEDYGEALRSAARLGNVEITQLLLDREDIDVNAAGKHQTALATATSYAKSNVVSVLLSHSEIDPNHTYVSREPFKIYQRVNNSHSFKLGPSKTLHGNISESPLLRAVKDGSLDTVKLLLNDSRVHTKSLDDTGRTPLWWATYKGSTEIVKLLLEKNLGEQVNKQDFQGWSPLHVAVNQACFSAFMILLSYPGIEPNLATEDGLTPLHMAIAGGVILMVKMLLDDSRVDCKCILTKSGKTPLDLAKEHGNEEVIALVSGLATEGTDTLRS